VFVVAPDKDGRTRVHARQVESGAMLGDEIVIQSGLTAGERIAALGSFKLRDGILVAIAHTVEQTPTEQLADGKP
jgi:membrane fusion protein (multidrug efflux system)